MRSRGLVQNAARGFTIVELMVVILIAAILAAMAAPSFLDFIARQQIRSAAYELAQTLQTARSKAILSRRSVDVRASYPTTGNNWNGTKTGTLFATNVAGSSTTGDQAKIAGSSFYIFETGSGLNSAATGVVNRVSNFSTLNSKVIVSADPVLIRYTSSSGVQASSSISTAPIDITADVTFTVTYSGSSNAGYSVTLNHFGGIQVKKN
jgi:prepilin-type N-terminal cleavage/methylation domain-containing protein